MNITFKEIYSPEELHSVSLRERASMGNKTVFTTHYAAVDGDTEIAFVAIDRIERNSIFCVFELFVEPTKRSSGYGTRIVNLFCHLAEGEKFRSICLVPHPIEVGGSEELLRLWYGRLGFLQSPEDSTLLEIVFSSTAQTER